MNISIFKQFTKGTETLPTLPLLSLVLPSSPPPTHPFFFFFNTHKSPFNLHSLWPPCQTPQGQKMTHQQVRHRIKFCAARKQLVPSGGTGRDPSSTPRHQGILQACPLAMQGVRSRLQTAAGQLASRLLVGPCTQEKLLRPCHPGLGSGQSDPLHRPGLLSQRTLMSPDILLVSLSLVTSRR